MIFLILLGILFSICNAAPLKPPDQQERACCRAILEFVRDKLVMFKVTEFYRYNRQLLTNNISYRMTDNITFFALENMIPKDQICRIPLPEKQFGRNFVYSICKDEPERSFLFYAWILLAVMVSSTSFIGSAWLFIFCYKCLRRISYMEDKAEPLMKSKQSDQIEMSELGKKEQKGEKPLVCGPSTGYVALTGDSELEMVHELDEEGDSELEMVHELDMEGPAGNGYGVRILHLLSRLWDSKSLLFRWLRRSQNAANPALSNGGNPAAKAIHEKDEANSEGCEKQTATFPISGPSTGNLFISAHPTNLDDNKGQEMPHCSKEKKVMNVT